MPVDKEQLRTKVKAGIELLNSKSTSLWELRSWAKDLQPYISERNLFKSGMKSSVLQILFGYFPDGLERLGITAVSMAQYGFCIDTFFIDVKASMTFMEYKRYEIEYYTVLAHVWHEEMYKVWHS